MAKNGKMKTVSFSPRLSQFIFHKISGRNEEKILKDYRQVEH